MKINEHSRTRIRTKSQGSKTKLGVWQKFRADRRGAALVEFSLLMPLLLGLTTGVIQYSFLLLTYNNMTNAAREGARGLSVDTFDETETEANMLGLLVPWPTNWVIDAQDIGTTGTDEVKVIITIPGGEAGVLDLLPAPANLRVEVTMRKE